jgi:glucose/arabinose dehydrogenase
LTFLALVLAGVALPGSLEHREPPVPSPTPAPGFSDVGIKLTRITTLKQSVALAVRRGDGAIYVATKDGRVFAVRDRRARVVLDIRPYVRNEGEAGLLGLVFTPDGKRMLIDFVNRSGDTRIRWYPFRRGVQVKAGKDLLRIAHPDINFHHSGNLVFGPDSYLYFSHGDGGIPRDPKNRAQSLDVMLGKIHRVRVRGDGSYSVPSDNPFVGREGARPEIWDYGLRNPWRFSFDAKTGDMWIADVGLTKREEIDFERASSKGGRNYGWSHLEGTLALKGDPPDGVVAPVYEIAHTKTNCAVIGGYVYRGYKIPGLEGAYLFGDLCDGRIRALRFRRGKPWVRTLPGKIDQLTSFGQDEAGELYVLSLNDGVFRIDPA